jgi:alkanesulfonate monooxygenase SsuD/methylene tetrahydromethanopterin reductase-like flavin-dependent oxidoreductase (luciferase family)
VEHRFREEFSHSSCPEAILSGLSQITRNIKLGFGVTLMPPKFSSPINTAERVSTVDIVSHGRVWGTGRSSPIEQMGFDLAIGSRMKREREEAVGHVVGMMTQRTYLSDSASQFMPERPCVPKPAQTPHPPCWLARSLKRRKRGDRQVSLGWVC